MENCREVTLAMAGKAPPQNTRNQIIIKQKDKDREWKIAEY